MFDADALLDEFDDLPRHPEEEIDLDDKAEEALDLDPELDEPVVELGEDGDFELDGGLEDLLSPDEVDSWSDDPVRMYLTQMGEIPLLTRQQEVTLAKQIEVTRASSAAKWWNVITSCSRLCGRFAAFTTAICPSIAPSKSP